MRQAEDAVLDTLADEILRPDRIEAALDRAITTWQASQVGREGKRLRLAQRAEELSREIANLTDALARGVAVTSIGEAIAARETERRRLYEELAAASAEAEWGRADRARLGKEFRAILADWRAELRADTAAARPVLRKLLPGRVRVVPAAQNGQEGFRLEGMGSVAAVLPAEVRKWYRYGDSNPGSVAENHVS
jgi:hypothetical protein